MIDLTPVLSYVAEIAVAALATVGVYLAKRMADHIGMELEDGAASTVERYIEMAVDAVVARIETERDVTDNATVREIVQWVSGHAPKSMRRAGLAADDIEGMVRRRLTDG